MRLCEYDCQLSTAVLFLTILRHLRRRFDSFMWSVVNIFNYDLKVDVSLFLDVMPFISKDWRSPGEEWVKTEEGWEKKKILECSNLVVEQHNFDPRYKLIIPLFTRSADRVLWFHFTCIVSSYALVL